VFVGGARTRIYIGLRVNPLFRVCEGCSFGGLGCCSCRVCVCVGGVVLCRCVCVCVCDLLIFFQASNEHVVATLKRRHGDSNICISIYSCIVVIMYIHI